jgi:hypothetical protein
VKPLEQEVNKYRIMIQKRTQMTESYLQTIQRMDDKKLLLVLGKKGDYTDEFLTLAAEEATKRGYDYHNVQFDDIDKLVFQHKTTDELVKIVSDESAFYGRYEVALAVAELEARDYDLPSLLAEVENKRKTRRRGNVSGCMFTFNGIGTKLYGKAKQDDGSYIATKWIVFLFVPLIPLASYLVLDWENTGILSRNYELIKVPLNKKQVGKTYLVTFSIIFVIFILPRLLFLFR